MIQAAASLPPPAVWLVTSNSPSIASKSWMLQLLRAIFVAMVKMRQSGTRADGGSVLVLPMRMA
jgi:hypothetical protein